MPCAARAPQPRPTLFVVAAHVPNQQNCALLRRTVATIHCFHPQDTVLVVDNNSPPGNVEDALHMSPAELALHVIRPAGPSRAQLGAWAAAWHWLQAAKSRAAAMTYARFALLQHSTILLGPLPPPLPGCDATALAGSEFWLTEKMRAYSHGEPHPKWFNPNKYLNRDMGYASAVAEALDIPCLPPCVSASRTKCSNWNYSTEVWPTPWRLALERTARVGPSNLHNSSSSSGGGDFGHDSGVRPPRRLRRCLEWGTVLHSVLALSPRGWATLAAFRLWPQGPSLPPLEQMAPIWNASSIRSPLGSLSSMNAEERARASRSQWAAPLIGLERLSGILLAMINEPTIMLHDDAEHLAGRKPLGVAPTRCALPAERVIHKVHGETTSASRNASRDEACPRI